MADVTGSAAQPTRRDFVHLLHAGRFFALLECINGAENERESSTTRLFSLRLERLRRRRRLAMWGVSGPARLGRAERYFTVRHLDKRTVALAVFEGSAG